MCLKSSICLGIWGKLFVWIFIIEIYINIEIRFEILIKTGSRLMGWWKLFSWKWQIGFRFAFFLINHLKKIYSLSSIEFSTKRCVDFLSFYYLHLIDSKVLLLNFVCPTETFKLSICIFPFQARRHLWTLFDKQKPKRRKI